MNLSLKKNYTQHNLNKQTLIKLVPKPVNAGLRYTDVSYTHFQTNIM